MAETRLISPAQTDSTDEIQGERNQGRHEYLPALVGLFLEDCEGLDQVLPQLDIVPRRPDVPSLMAWGRCSGTTILGAGRMGLI